MTAPRATRKLRRVHRAGCGDKADLGAVACSEGIAVVDGNEAKGDGFEHASSNPVTIAAAEESTSA